MLPVVRGAAVMVRFVSVLVLLVGEGLGSTRELLCKLVWLLAWTEEGTSEEPLTLVSGRTTCFLSAFCLNS